jgi:hypothetical protein
MRGGGRSSRACPAGIRMRVHRLENLTRYDTNLDRKFECTLAMLLSRPCIAAQTPMPYILSSHQPCSFPPETAVIPPRKLRVFA